MAYVMWHQMRNDYADYGESEGMKQPVNTVSLLHSREKILYDCTMVGQNLNGFVAA